MTEHAQATDIPVTCALIEHEDRVLIAQRSGSEARSGLWEFPGGKLEAGEDEASGLIREISEELNITVKPLQRLSEVVHHYPDKSIRLLPWRCTQIGDQALQLTAHTQIKWVRPSELGNYQLSAADVEVAQHYIEFLINQTHE